MYIRDCPENFTAGGSEWILLGGGAQILLFIGGGDQILPIFGGGTKILPNTNYKKNNLNSSNKAI